MRKTAILSMLCFVLFPAIEAQAGTTLIEVRTEPGGDIQAVNEGDPYPNDAPENARGALFWNGSRWVTNDTAAHTYFWNLSTDRRLKEYNVVSINSNPGNLGTTSPYPGYSVTKSLYTYTTRAASGVGTYSYEALQYVFSLPDTTTVILRSRGTGHGTAQAYFDVYV